MFTHTTIRTCLCVLALFGPVACAQTPELRSSVEKGLGYVTKTTVAWKEAHGCASCHHAPLMLWSCNEARKKGYTVDESAVETVRKWLVAEDNSARMIAPKEPADRFVFSVASAYTTLALASGPPEEVDAAAVMRFRNHYLEKQEPDGSFLINGQFKGTPPILEGGSNGTCLASLAFGVLPGLTPEQAAAAKKAEAWLANPAENLTEQEMALRLLVAVRVTHADSIPAQAAALLSLQNPDGSWGQNAEMAGDAYATGQALCALGAAGMRATEPPIAEAIAFLFRTQLLDGSWKMISRTAGPDGKPAAKNLEPITASAAAWALIGMLAVS